MNKHFEALAKAIVGIVAAEVVNLVDSKREPIADAAQFLHCDHGFTANWLRHHEAISITRYAGDLLTMSRQRVAMMYLFEPARFKADSFGVVMNGELYEPSVDGWGFKRKYPDRQKVADAAQFLWRYQLTGDWVATLQRYSPGDILGVCEFTQKHLCSRVADAAWYIYDQGGYRAALTTHTGDQLLLLADRIKARIVHDEAEQKAQRRIVAALSISGRGRSGELISVDRIPVLEGTGPVYVGGAFVNDLAGKYGIVTVDGVVTSFGPGIFS